MNAAFTPYGRAAELDSGVVGHPGRAARGRVMVPKGKRVNGMPSAHSGQRSAGQVRLGTVLAG